MQFLWKKLGNDRIGRGRNLVRSDISARIQFPTVPWELKLRGTGVALSLKFHFSYEWINLLSIYLPPPLPILLIFASETLFFFFFFSTPIVNRWNYYLIIPRFISKIRFFFSFFLLPLPIFPPFPPFLSYTFRFFALKLISTRRKIDNPTNEIKSRLIISRNTVPFLIVKFDKIMIDSKSKIFAIP